MFGRRKDDKFGNKAPEATKQAAKPNGEDTTSRQNIFARESQSRSSLQVRDGKTGGRGSVSTIGPDLKIEGLLHSDGEIRIDGQIDGNIRSEMLIIGEHGQINGEVITNEVTVFGRVTGNIRSRKVQLMKSAHVIGDIYHNILAIETGAFFEGKSQHVDDPLSADKPRRKAATPKPATTNGAPGGSRQAR